MKEKIEKIVNRIVIILIIMMIGIWILGGIIYITQGSISDYAIKKSINNTISFWKNPFNKEKKIDREDWFDSIRIDERVLDSIVLITEKDSLALLKGDSIYFDTQYYIGYANLVIDSFSAAEETFDTFYIYEVTISYKEGANKAFDSGTYYCTAVDFWVDKRWDGKVVRYISLYEFDSSTYGTKCQYAGIPLSDLEYYKVEPIIYDRISKKFIEE